MKYQVKFEVKYRWVPEQAESCQAEVVVCIPAGTADGGIERVFVSGDRDIAHAKLAKYWGYTRSDGFRQSSHLICSKTWEELQSEVNSYIDKVATQLHEIASYNSKMLASKPSDVTRVFDIEV